ncbi:MAG: tetratricopeptide repeat protein [Thermodesulforhabdaceae bacterium]
MKERVQSITTSWIQSNSLVRKGARRVAVLRNALPLLSIIVFALISCTPQHPPVQQPDKAQDGATHSLSPQTQRQAPRPPSPAPAPAERIEGPESATIPQRLSGSPEELKAMGQNYLAAGNIGMALRYLKAAEARRPKDPQLLYEIALAYQRRGFRDQTKEYLQKALAVQPDYAEASNALGAILAEEGRFEEARKAFEKALNNPYYETPQLAAYNLGSLFYRMGKYEEAKKYYQQAIELSPNYAAAHLELARTLEALGDNAKALDEYKEALQYDPDSVMANFGYGRLLYQHGDYVAAKYYLERVTKLAPDTPTAKAALDYLSNMETPGRTRKTIGR